MFIMVTFLAVILMIVSINTSAVPDQVIISETEVPLGQAIIAKKELNQPGSFIIYYNELNDQNIKVLSEYDVVVIEPRNATKRQVVELKKSGAKVFGYISVVEQNENNLEFLSIKDSWYYKPEGKKIKVDKWGSWVVDITNRGYRNFLLEQILYHVVNKDLDGIFFDTVGDIDDYNWDESDKIDMRESYTKFLKKIKKNYSKLEIIQNWGFETAKNHSSKYLDGIMWEGFSYDLIEKDKWSMDRYKEVQNMNLDFYAVTPMEQGKDVILKYNTKSNNKTYIFTRNSDIYDHLD